MKYIDNPLNFLLVNDYSFSLFGAIFGFLLVLKILTKLEKSSITRYIDGVVLSFLFVLVIGYVGALLGGQVYGEPTSFGIEIRYTHPYTQVEYQVPVFPLPIVYAMLSFAMFSGLYIYSLFSRKQGLIGYLGLALFSVMVLIFDTFNGKSDILSVVSPFNLPQVFALALGAWSLYHLVDVLRTETGGQDAII